MKKLITLIAIVLLSVSAFAQTQWKVDPLPFLIKFQYITFWN
jgi:hypothetical protein